MNTLSSSYEICTFKFLLEEYNIYEIHQENTQMAGHYIAPNYYPSHSNTNHLQGRAEANGN